MNPDANACRDFVIDINAFVDEELVGDDLARVMGHVQDCDGCQDYMDALRDLSAAHRVATARIDEEVVGQLDPRGLFTSITRDLLEEKQGALARLFYELGKAYVLIGNREADPADRQTVATTSRALDVRSAESKARRTLNEAEGLASAGQHERASSLFKRSRRLFGTSRWAGSGALAKGRAYLEEALAIEPELDEARLYLGFQHHVADRLDRARLEFRKVHRDGRKLEHRLMALHWLGRLHANQGDYQRAVECDEEVLRNQPSDADLFPYLMNLVVNSIKAGRVDDSCRHLETLEERYPTRVPQARSWLADWSWLNGLLARNSNLHDDLRRRAPAFFAV